MNKPFKDNPQAREELEKYCDSVGISDLQKVNRFLGAVEIAVSEYRTERLQPSNAEVKRQIVALHKALHGFLLKGRPFEPVAEAFDRFSDEARQVVWVGTLTDHPFPDYNDVNPDNPETLKQLFSAVSRGMTWKTGRKRAKGKVGGGYWEAMPNAPLPKRGRPSDQARRSHLLRLAWAYAALTDRTPTRWRTDGDRGEFVSLVSKVREITEGECEDFSGWADASVKDFLTWLKAANP